MQNQYFSTLIEDRSMSVKRTSHKDIRKRSACFFFCRYVHTVMSIDIVIPPNWEHEVSGKQNSLFPEGTVIKCLL